MPQVPYKGYPEGGPQHVPLRPDIPEAGLLAGVRAAESFGKTLGAVGDEIFNIAMKKKEEENQTEADEANVRFMTQAGDLHSKYGALQGKDRADAFEGYKNNLIALRDGIAGELSNDRVKRLFLGKSSGTLGHSIFNGAGQAATAQKDWTNNVAIANQDAATFEYSQSPLSPTVRRDKLGEIERSARIAADTKHGGGTDSVIADMAARDAKSNALLEGIKTISKTRPELAEEMMHNDWKLLNGKDRIAATNIVTSQATTIGGDNIANQVLEWGKETELQPQKTLKQMQDEVDRRVKERDSDGNLPLLGKTARSSLQTGFNQGNYATRLEAQQRVQDITGIIQVKNPRTLTELLQDPKAFELFHSMKPEEKLKVKGTIDAWKEGRTITELSDNYKKLRSMASDDTEAFMNTSPGDWKVGKGDWNTLMNVRKQILKDGAINDPRTDRAFKWLANKYGTTMDAMKVLDKTRDRAAYHLFRGGLAIALDQFQEENKRPANEKDVVDTIWPQLRTEAQRPRRFLGYELPGTQTTEPFWKVPVPNDPQLRRELDKEIMKGAPPGRAEPTETERQFEYHRQLWQTFNKNKGK